MEFFVYVVYSATADRYQIGHTNNVDARLYRLNTGRARHLQAVDDWKSIYVEPFADRRHAIRREMQIKTSRSQIFLEMIATLKEYHRPFQLV